MKLLTLLFTAAILFAQAPAPAEKEQADLSAAMAEAGTSGTDLTRALEKHLAKYPNSPQRAAIEKALAQWAIELNDTRRIVLYGERVLKAEPNNELQLIDHVIRALLLTDDPESAKKALIYAKRYEDQVEALRSHAPEGHYSTAQWGDQVDKNKSRALVLEARATGNSGNREAAAAIARSAWQLAATEESARETGRWLAKLDRKAEAARWYADAFAADDATPADRLFDRGKAGELYASASGSEQGLGDLFLKAIDEVQALGRAHEARLKQADPNYDVAEIAGFTLPRVSGGESLPLSSLKGKTVVLDFWATWCGPCVAQHPLLENVKKKFEKDGNVVFLSVNSDDDRELVEPFLKEKRWSGPVYFEGGLSRLLKISSIPTLIVLDPQGQVSSRMSGYIPDLFEDMLSQRIEDTRGN